MASHGHKTTTDPRHVNATGATGRWAMMCVIIALAACSLNDTYSQYHSLDASQWNRQLPLRWHPTLPDSAASYDVDIAVRHSGAYRYANLAVRLDFIGNDGTLRSRQVMLRLTDDEGNWRGAGFGSLYQLRTTVATDVPAGELKSVVAWQAMDSVECLHDVAEVGLFVTPSSK